MDGTDDGTKYQLYNKGQERRVFEQVSSERLHACCGAIHATVPLQAFSLRKNGDTYEAVNDAGSVLSLVGDAAKNGSQYDWGSASGDSSKFRVSSDSAHNMDCLPSSSVLTADRSGQWTVPHSGGGEQYVFRSGLRSRRLRHSRVSVAARRQCNTALALRKAVSNDVSSHISRYFTIVERWRHAAE